MSHFSSEPLNLRASNTCTIKDHDKENHASLLGVLTIGGVSYHITQTSGQVADFHNEVVKTRDKYNMTSHGNMFAGDIRLEIIVQDKHKAQAARQQALNELIDLRKLLRHTLSVKQDQLEAAATANEIKYDEIRALYKERRKLKARLKEANQKQSLTYKQSYWKRTMMIPAGQKRWSFDLDTKIEWFVDLGRSYEGHESARVTVPEGFGMMDGSFGGWSCPIVDVNATGRFVQAWGTKGSGSGQFNHPYGVCCDDEYLYVVDGSNNRIQVFSKEGEFVQMWGYRGWGDGCPTGVSCDSKHLYVADCNNNRIQVFDKEGRFVRKWGSEGSDNEQFVYPHNLCCDEQEVYVTDTNNHRIQVFTKEGVFISKWGVRGEGNGQFSYPRGICCDEGYVYVADAWNHRIQIFDKEGVFVRKWGSYGMGEGQLQYPCFICCDASYIYVTDKNNHRIQVFDKEGTFVRSWGDKGNDNGKFDMPAGICCDMDRVFVVETNNCRIQVFK